MKLRSLLAAGAAVAVSAVIAYGAGMFENFPIVGGASFCSGTSGTSNANLVSGQPGTPVTCVGSQVPAGPSGLTGNELIAADTALANSAPPQTVVIPSGMLSPYGTNVLVGADFGQSLWQRGTTPINASALGQAVYGPDGWYATTASGAAAQTVTVSKQTGATDIPTSLTNTTASARIQRVNAQTGTQTMQFGQLVPNDSSARFPGNTAIFSCYLLAGANFSPTAGNVNMVIAYHSAADATSAAANGQGTNTATFASSVSGTQNITNYTEAVNQAQAATTSWARYSVAAAIPLTIPNSTTAVTGIGVKLTWVPAGTAGANDWLEVSNCQLEARPGTSIGPSAFNRRTLADEYALELARYYQITEAGSGTPFYATGYIPSTSLADVMVQFPTLMRITPVSSPITLGGFKFLVAGTATSPASITTSGTTNTTPRTAGLVGVGVGSATAGQGTILTGNSGTGVLGFSAEP